jgi:hypothetical protein
MTKKVENSNNAETPSLNIAGVSGCFYLLSEIKPPKNGKYEVITSRGRVVKINYESFLGNDIWEAEYELHQINESVVAWRYVHYV